MPAMPMPTRSGPEWPGRGTALADASIDAGSTVTLKTGSSDAGTTDDTERKIKRGGLSMRDANSQGGMHSLRGSIG